MDKIVDKIFQVDYDEISSYNFPLNELFGLKVNYCGILYCFIIKFSSDNPNLVCFGPGAHQRNSTKSTGESIYPPYFDRWSWYQYLDESFIAYADPMFFYDDEIVLGWFVGNNNQWYLEIVSRIIKKLLSNQKILPKNTLFFGSSGGGFSSVCLGNLIKESKVIVNNAQFFVLNFNSPANVLDKLFSILEKDFSLSKEKIIPQIIHRLDVIELFKKECYIPEITYYVNVESKYDIYSQALPFIEKIQKLDLSDNDFNIQFYHDRKEDPHNPMTFNKTINCIRNYFSSQNFVKIANVCFYFPKSFYSVGDKNSAKITDENYTIYFSVHHNSDIHNCILNYQKMKKNDCLKLDFSRCDINNLKVCKSIIVDDEYIMHFWFEYKGDVYEIYTWDGNSDVKKIILDIINSIRLFP